MKRVRQTKPLIARVLLCSLAVGLHSANGQTKTNATITIDAARVVNSINPLLYGQFIEHMFEGVKYGLHAELLRDRSFEEPPDAIGLPRHWQRYPDNRADDYALKFTWDDSVKYPDKRESDIPALGTKAEHSLQVDVSNGVILKHGFYQGDIPIKAGITYRGYVWLRTATVFNGSLTVALESNVNAPDVYASAAISNISGDWRKYEFNLRPQKTDPLARLVFRISGHGRLWMDQASLVPGDAGAGQVRHDVFDLVKRLRPAFIRWPGGNVAQDYRWRWGTGPRDTRPIWTNLSWRNEDEPSDFGTDEFIEFARAVGAEPSITVNVEGRGATAQEAAAWVEYCNGPATSKYGSLRAANGHPQPFNVRLWEVGNEIWGDWVRGHSDAETYASNLVTYARAMRAVDPGIKLIAVGDNNMNWNRTVLQKAGELIDYLAVHHYYGRNEMKGEDGNLFARPLHFESFYSDISKMLAELKLGGKVQLAINEWGLDLPEDQQYSMESALYAARLMNVFERSGSVVGMSAVSDLVNGWPGGIIQSARNGVFVSSIFIINELYANHLGSEVLATSVNGPIFDTSREGKGVPFLDAVATRSADKKRVFIKAVNTSASVLSTTVELRNGDCLPRAEMFTVNSPIQAANSFATPDAIAAKRSMIASSRTFTVSLPPKSVLLIIVTLKN